MKIKQLLEAKYVSKPAYRNLSNEKIIELFLVYEEEMSEEGEEGGPTHFYTREDIHIQDQQGEINWVVIHKKGTYRKRDYAAPARNARDRNQLNDKTVYIVLDHNNDTEWQTDPQKWKISHLQTLFDGQ